MSAIYLDHNATTPMLPAVVDAMSECGHAAYANPASAHAAGRHARRVVDRARDEIGRILGTRWAGTDADRVVFTSGGTEANNLALFGLAATAASRRPGRIVTSAIEHPSVAGCAAHLKRCGWQIDHLPVSPDGVVLVDQLADLLTDDTRLVSVMLGNNETGVLQPVSQIAALCRPRRIPLHCDAVQCVGKIPVDFRALGVDVLAASAHKFHGPRGIGLLIVRDGVQIEPLLHGGFQQDGLRPGSQPVELIVGMCAALELWEKEATQRTAHLAQLRDSLEADLRAGWPDLVVNGLPAARLPHTTNVAFVGLDRQALVMALDLAGVACSTGSACASGSSEPSPVLLAMGCAPPIVQASIRLSVGATNTLSDVRLAAQRILRVVNQLHRQIPARSRPVSAPIFPPAGGHAPSKTL